MSEPAGAPEDGGLRDAKALRAMLRYLQWNTACGGTYCKVCFQFKEAGHADDCELADLIANG